MNGESKGRYSINKVSKQVNNQGRRHRGGGGGGEMGTRTQHF